MADLKLLCWEGYETAAILQPFTNQHGIKIHAETLLSDADTAQRLSSGEISDCDILNINNAYIRDYLYPYNLIKTLDHERFQPYFDRMLPQFKRLYRWAYNNNGQLIGICQRFGPFSLVINTDRISHGTAEQLGFNLANEPGNRARFGILSYEDFNIFHFCIGAGLNPFTKLDDNALEVYRKTAHNWFQYAARVEDDHLLLNQALIDGEIDFYISGGIYTASPARLAGYHNIRAITPISGPIDGSGGIVFTEITSVLNSTRNTTLAEDFLEYLLQPDTAIKMAFADGTCNPVTQMGDPDVFAAFSTAQLDAIQWDTLEADIARSADYQIPPNHSQLLTLLRTAKHAAGWLN